MNRLQFADLPSMNRRDALSRVACGFGSFAAMAIAARARPAYAVNEAINGSVSLDHPAKAKRVIFLFMQGGVSQVDSFDYKPELARRDGEQISFDDARTVAKTGQRGSKQRLMQSPWKFSQHGECGRQVSELFPETAKHSDKLCMLHAMHTEGVAHGPATLFLHCGSTNFVRPSFGSWAYYGLGTENENLPGFISIAPSIGNGGARNYGSAFLPPQFQGTRIGGASDSNISIANLDRSDVSLSERQSQLDLLASINQSQLAAKRGADDRLDAVIQSYELAARMQTVGPDTLNLDQETEATQERYGLNDPATRVYGQRCLLARRLCESGVRFVQVNYGDNTANPAWDQHSNLPRHADHAKAVDQPIAALLQDLDERGLLEDTIVWWGGEFGRTPYAQDNGTGRDHNPGGFTSWVAGGGFKPGFAYGETDEFGFQGIQGKVHMHDLHATFLHQLGLDHEQLTYRFAGRDFRLTDVHGRVVKDILA
jgi:hypothetical protein